MIGIVGNDFIQTLQEIRIFRSKMETSLHLLIAKYDKHLID